jgi:hypothetical protein
MKKYECDICRKIYDEQLPIAILSLFERAAKTFSGTLHLCISCRGKYFSSNDGRFYSLDVLKSILRKAHKKENKK